MHYCKYYIQLAEHKWKRKEGKCKKLSHNKPQIYSLRLLVRKEESESEEDKGRRKFNNL